MSLQSPMALLLLLPLAGGWLLMLRRRRAAPGRMAILWMLRREDASGKGPGQWNWKNPTAALFLLAGLLWIAALAQPRFPAGVDDRLPTLILLDAGLPSDHPQAAELLEEILASHQSVEIHASGRLPSGPFHSLEELEAAGPDPLGPTLGELLERVNPSGQQRVEIFGWNELPSDRGSWHSHRFAELRPRIWTAGLDGDGNFYLSASPRWVGSRIQLESDSPGVSLELDGRGRCSAVLDPALESWRLRWPDAGYGDVDFRLPETPIVWLLSGEDHPWTEAIRLWPHAEIRRIQRERLPAPGQDWTSWRRSRGGGSDSRQELLVVTGAAIAQWPRSIPWLWVAPLRGESAGLAMGSRTSGESLGEDLQSRDWEGLDLSSSERAQEITLESTGWSREAGGRILSRPDAAVLNLISPFSAQGAEAALAALRLSRRWLPSLQVRRGFGPPSPSFSWPLAPESNGEASPAGWTNLSFILVIAAWGLSALALLIWPLRGRLQIAMAVMLLTVPVGLFWKSATDHVLILDASISCREGLPHAVEPLLEELRSRGGDRLAISVLDGEGGRWILPPTTISGLPFSISDEEPAFETWFDAQAELWPEFERTRLQPSLGRLLGAFEFGNARYHFFSDGFFSDRPEELQRILPPERTFVHAVEAGRSADAAILQAKVIPAMADGSERVEVEIRAGDVARELTLDLDGMTIHRSPVLGSTRMRFPLPRTGQGNHQIGIVLDAEGDRWPANDRFDLHFHHGDLPSIRWLGDGGHRPSTLGEHSRSAADLWVLDGLDEAGVRLWQDELSDALDRGAGLLWLAGPGSWLLEGRTDELEIERRLPVRLKVSERRREDPTRWIILLDASGSMATGQGQLSRYEQALTALAFAQENQQDKEIGLVIFADRVLRSLPPRKDRNAQDLQQAMGGISPNGGTSLRAALGEAESLLREDPGPAHILLLSDGITGSEPLASWEQVLGEHRLHVLEVGDRASHELEILSVRSGGSYRQLDDFSGLAEIMAEKLESEERSRWISRPEQIRAMQDGWRAPGGAVSYCALSLPENPVSQIQVPWVAGELDDPLLVLSAEGTGRIAVLATTPGPPWTGENPFWDEIIVDLLAWLAPKREPQLRRMDFGVYRLQGDRRAVSWADAHSITLQAADGSRAPVEAILPGFYRPTGVLADHPVLLIQGEQKVLGRLGQEDPRREWRQWGVDRRRLESLRSGLQIPQPGNRRIPIPSRGLILLCSVVWILASLLTVLPGKTS